LEVLEVKQRLEESKRQAELEKFQQENNRVQKHRQQLKDKVCLFPIFHDLVFFSFFFSLMIIIPKKNKFV